MQSIRKRKWLEFELVENDLREVLSACVRATGAKKDLAPMTINKALDTHPRQQKVGGYGESPTRQDDS